MDKHDKIFMNEHKWMSLQLLLVSKGTVVLRRQASETFSYGETTCYT